MIDVAHLTKRFGSQTVLDDVSFNVQKGTIHGFLGPNGAGKSTTIKILMNYLFATSGIAMIDGLDTARDSVAVHERVGYVAGDMELYANLTGDQYLRFVARLRGAGDYDHVKPIIERLKPTLNKKIGKLSRGNKQKIGLLAALIDDPDVLILDEPTTGLDPLMQQTFFALMRERRKRGKTVFMSSHILAEVQEVCDTITFMRSGKVIDTLDVAHMMATAKRHVVMKFAPASAIVKPTAQLGATNIKQTKTSLSFDVVSSDRKVMRWIAMQPVIDVSITEFSLENVFMDMYEESRE